MISTTASPLHAEPGDRIVIRGHHVGAPARDGEIIEVLGSNGGPPYMVRWEDNGHVSRLYPSSDAYVQHFKRQDMAAEWEAATPPSDS